jgi:hypothetical protein
VKSFLKPFIIVLPLIAGLLTMNSCHKELFTNKGGVSFSTDTLTFDTVFTSLATVTMSFTVRNTQSKAINISDIKLLQLSGTQFRFAIFPYTAVSGANTTVVEYKNLNIPAHDSIYVYVEATINPSAANNPFIITDKLQFVTNGITQDVVLEAMGQNAHYYFSQHVTATGGTFTFPTDKPNIIVNKNGGLSVFAVDSNATCIIPPGCKIFMGPNAVLTVDGTLMTSPTASWSDSIIFQYIRTDYQNLPGQWLGITYSRVATINLSHVIIDQSTFGISDEYVLDQIAQSQITTSNLKTYHSDHTPNVTLNNVIIRNASITAMTALQTNLLVNNSLFCSAGGQMVVLGLGGTYTLNNCTLANGYSPSGQNHQSPSLTIINAAQYIDQSQVGPYATSTNISNTIVAGTLQNEVGFSNPATGISATFSNCFLTAVRDSISAYATNTNNIDSSGDPQMILQPALFTSPLNNNYMPDSASIVLGKANASSQKPTDLYDYNRPSPGSIGAVEWHH